MLGIESIRCQGGARPWLKGEPGRLVQPGASTPCAGYSCDPICFLAGPRPVALHRAVQRVAWLQHRAIGAGRERAQGWTPASLRLAKIAASCSQA